MATVTPNFNWPVPTSTDLVKDGATAIEALGDSIDASLVDLKGGTTGQVLSKTSGTDMDFTWVTSDDANAIQNSIVDAKGDLIAASANDTPARLAVGANGETLVADSSTSTGLRYQSAKTTNGIYNSSFQVWQRGTTSASTANIYTADRWQKGAATSATVSRQVTGDTTNLPFIQYCARVQRTAGSAVLSGIDFAQSLETLDAIKYAGRTITYSFYARAGANYSSASNVLNTWIYSGTGTDQSVISGFTGLASAASTAPALTTTWQRFQATGTVSAAATGIAFYASYSPLGTAGANDYFEITGVQIEYGSVATSYASMTGSIQGELAACQRYFEKSFAQATAPATNAGRTGANEAMAVRAATALFPVVQRFAVLKRTASPTMAYFNPSAANSQWRNLDTGTDLTSTTTDTTTESNFAAYATLPASSVSTNLISFHWTASAEL